MIKNIVFDLGGVLVSWEPKKAIREIMGNLSDEDIEKIHTTMFTDKMLLAQRNGFCTREDVYRSYVENNAENGDKYCQIFELADSMSEQYKTTAPLLKELKEAGFQLYFISDNNVVSVERLKAKADRGLQSMVVLLKHTLLPKPHLMKI